MTVTRNNIEVGTLSFQSAAMQGEVISAPRLPQPQLNIPEGVTVVATAMYLPLKVRQRLSEEFGAGYIVLDLNEAPESAEVVLVNPVSPQLLAHLHSRFPSARVVITEIDDEEHGINYSGPVGRALESGASAYIPPRPIKQVAESVAAHIENAKAAALASIVPPHSDIDRGKLAETSRPQLLQEQATDER